MKISNGWVLQSKSTGLYLLMINNAGHSSSTLVADLDDASVFSTAPTTRDGGVHDPFRRLKVKRSVETTLETK